MNVNFTPEQKDYKKIGAFKFFCIQNFPFIADTFDQMTYYELLCKLAEYIKKLIDNNNSLIYNQEALLNAFNELQEYVNDYFSELNVQNEIDHKLDEMTESGYFENILDNYVNITKVFNTTSDLIESEETFVNGQKIKTLGYYDINDGGGADFIVSDTENSDIFQIELYNNMYANLIIKNNEVNVKSLGCKGDGINDDGTILQNIINTLSSSFEIYKDIIIIIPAGKYIINSKIDLPVYLTLKPIGSVIFLSNVSNDSTIYINSRNLQKQIGRIAYYDQSYINKPVISGAEGSLILQYNQEDSYIYTNLITLNNIGLEIGDDIYTSTKISCSRFIVENVNIYGFGNGLLLNKINTYLIKFINCNIQRNRVNLQLGKNDSTSKQNMGENFTFDKCTLALSFTAILIYESCELNLNNCSIDFSGCVFDIESYSPCVINCLGGHIEGVGITNSEIQTDISNTTGWGSVCYNNIQDTNGCTYINFFGTVFYQATQHDYTIPKFRSTLNNNADSYSKHLSVAFYGTNIHLKGGNTFKNIFLTEDYDTEITHYTEPLKTGMCTYISTQMDYQGRFEHLPENALLNTTLRDNYNYYCLPDDKITEIKIDKINKIYNRSLKLSFENTNNITLRRYVQAPQKAKIKFVCFVDLSDVVSDTENTFDHFTLSYQIQPYNDGRHNVGLGKTVNLTSSASFIKDTNSNFYRTNIPIQLIPQGTSQMGIGINLKFYDENNTQIACSGNVKIGALLVDFCD